MALEWRRRRVTVFCLANYRYSGAPQRLSLKLPVMVNKFMEAADMNGEAFFQRWKALSQ